ncbi:hypothetical protein ACFWNW_00685 [Streptomyces seoulensis]|uniref:hypothetical protein n=1 Tax=Streptomyces seoulensis TaxID=73044 RepID=UPI00366372E7
MTHEIGLTWVAEQCDEMTDLSHTELDCLVERGPVSTTVMVAARSVTDLEPPANLQLGRDTRRLLESAVSDETIRTAWIGSTDHAFDPRREGVDARVWLEMLDSAWLAAKIRQEPGFNPPAADPVADEASRVAVLRAMGPFVVGLTRAHVAGEQFNEMPLPHLMPALEQVVSEVCADLGFRLFLRALKRYELPVDGCSLAAFTALGEQFGFPEPLVEEGLPQI